MHIIVVMSLEHFIVECVSQKQCLSFLVADKDVSETVSLSEHWHVDVLNRVDLWKVDEDVIAIFSDAEAYFLSSTRNYKIKSCPKI